MRQKKIRSTIMWIVIAIGLSAFVGWMMKDVDDATLRFRLPIVDKNVDNNKFRDGLSDRTPWSQPQPQSGARN